MINKWLKLSKENGRFQSYINLRSCALQSSRIADIKFNNMELKRRRFRSIFNENQVKYNLSHIDDKTQLITNYDPIDSPSVNPLPLLTSFN